MRQLILAIFIVFAFFKAPLAAEPKVLVSGLKNPRAVIVGFDGRVYVSVADDLEKSGTGAVLAIENGKAVPFAKGMDSPGWMTLVRDMIFVTDKDCVWRVDKSGKATQFAKRTDFPGNPTTLTGICVDERGILYVAARGEGNRCAVFRLSPRGKAERIALAPHQPEDFAFAGIAMDGMSHVLTLGRSGTLYRLQLSDGALQPRVFAEPFLNVNAPSSPEGVVDPIFGGLVWDHFGRLFMTGQTGYVEVLPRPDAHEQRVGGPLKLPGAPCLSPDRASILVPDAKAGTIVELPAQVPGAPVDESPLPIETEVAFPDLKWFGWSEVTPAGKVVPLRPIELTHANDQSGRVFVATQHGVVHVFPNNPATRETKVFVDIQKRVRYSDNANEEGLLGLAFHPKYKKNGEFFVFYTEPRAGHHNVVSRFRVSKDDPDKADPASEEVLLNIDHKYWNHDGGTIVFGPDGCLYIAIGDGGSANDPDQNGQNMNTLLAKIIRIDVDRKGEGLPYAIPKDNPFVGQKDKRPEIWASGLRNVWRMAFDRGTGRLWAADVGQNLYEEIDLIEKGGNYGWNVREGLHPFGPKGVGQKPEMIDPIWEYHHDVGKSITGGPVYRGSQFPELVGSYLYADYVSGKIWALKYDEKLKRVVANRSIHDRKAPIMSFGEDDRGEVYLLTYSANGQGIHRLKRKP